MNKTKAYEVIKEYRQKSILTDEDEFIYIEALNYMIHETKNVDFMAELGSYYYSRQMYDQALKYYEMADTYGDKWAAEGLGYIWYYGRTGKVDYEKAFHYYSKASENGSLKSEIKVADMYKNGYYVEKDYDKYCDIVENMIIRIKHPKYLGDPFPEVCSRLARIRKETGKTDEAVSLYLDAKFFLRQRIRYTCFFGDLNIMKWLIEDLYTMIPFDEDHFDLYDLYYLLKTPQSIRFRYKNKSYEVKSEESDGNIAVRFGNKWYRTIDDFFNEAAVNDDKLIAIDEELYGFEVLK